MIRNPFAAPIGRRLHRSTTRAVTLGSAAVLALGLTASLGTASAAPPASAKPVAHEPTATHPRDFDLRSNGAALARNDARLRVSPRPGVSSLRKTLGPQGVVSLDPLTGTPRTVARLDGFLTGPSRRRADRRRARLPPRASRRVPASARTTSTRLRLVRELRGHPRDAPPHVGADGRRRADVGRRRPPAQRDRRRRARRDHRRAGRGRSRSRTLQRPRRLFVAKGSGRRARTLDAGGPAGDRDGDAFQLGAAARDDVRLGRRRAARAVRPFGRRDIRGVAWRTRTTFVDDDRIDSVDRETLRGRARCSGGRNLVRSDGTEARVRRTTRAPASRTGGTRSRPSTFPVNDRLLRRSAGPITPGCSRTWTTTTTPGGQSKSTRGERHGLELPRRELRHPRATPRTRARTAYPCSWDSGQAFARGRRTSSRTRSRSSPS